AAHLSFADRALDRDGMRAVNVTGAGSAKDVERRRGGKAHRNSPRTGPRAPIPSTLAFGFDIAAARVNGERAVDSLNVYVARARAEAHRSRPRQAQADVSAARAALDPTAQVVTVN